jgi:hypothetical protein
MVIFHSYVKLPEGIQFFLHDVSLPQQPLVFFPLSHRMRQFCNRPNERGDALDLKPKAMDTGPTGRSKKGPGGIPFLIGKSPFFRKITFFSRIITIFKFGQLYFSPWEISIFHREFQFFCVLKKRTEFPSFSL